jgi:hypothetical protein
MLSLFDFFTEPMIPDDAARWLPRAPAAAW